ncbi:sialidase family protein [Kribbella shirazensis]|uniref:exo-alpha-sialidase n=1 Tax=Kribbella shirazensis TaxID=1105143 RepID=A0A7X5ZZ91_9ACTN|nr:sialidase-1 [Kribbella shirazensis]
MSSATGLTASVAGAVRAEATGPTVEFATVFRSLMDGYHTFRIPAVIKAPDGTVLAFAEGRRVSAADSGDINLVLRRSHDRGRTWDPLQVVGDNGPNTFGNPVPIVDPASGDIVLLSTHNAGHVNAGQIRRGEVTAEETRRVFVQRSADSGATWSDPAEITAAVKPPDWKWYSTGPGHGIALRHGPHAGRLVAPCNHSFLVDGVSRENSHVIYSDDGGRTWRLGAVATQTGDAVGNENAVTERTDGTLYFNARNSHLMDPGNRITTTSSDGGETFDGPYVPVPDIVAPQVQGSVLTLSPTVDPRERIVISSPGHYIARENLTLRSSFDHGRTWNDGVVLYDGPAGYSDLVELGQDNDIRLIGSLYENGDRLHEIVPPGLAYHQRISFARVPVPVLDTVSLPPRMTPDESGRDNNAVVSGRPAFVPGGFGRGLALAGDYVEFPKSSDLALADDPFTVAVWFRTEYTKAAQALFWAHSSATERAKWRIAIEDGRLRALLDDTVTARFVDAPGSFTDGRWHHVALVRDTGETVLYADGVRAGTAGPIPGSVSVDAPAGVRVGARVDGVNWPFVGAMDEVWVIREALDATRVKTLMTTNGVSSRAVVAHLPLNRIFR